MKAKLLTLILTLLIGSNVIFAQNTFPSTGAVGIGTITPNASALLDMESTSKGLLAPHMTLVERNAIATPAIGLLIYQTNGTPGFYYYNGSTWTAISSKGANSALSNLKSPTAVNADILPGANNTINLGNSNLRYASANVYTLGFGDGSAQTTAFKPYTAGTGISISGTAVTNTAPDQTVVLNNGTGINVSGIYPNFTIASTVTPTQWTTNGSNIYYNNGSVGIGTATPAAPLDVAGDAHINGMTIGLGGGSNGYNSIVGYQALFYNTTGSDNSAFGYDAMLNNTTGFQNTANGAFALYSNTTGYYNTATGQQALTASTAGSDNTADGGFSLYRNTSGSVNTASGFEALNYNTTGSANTANGSQALNSNTTGSYNEAIGEFALYSNTTGNSNTAAGNNALFQNTTGYSNVGIGTSALALNTTVSNLVAVGDSSLYNNQGSDNTAIGSKTLYSNTTGNANSAIGWRALYYNVGGLENTATGMQALYDNSSGNNNTATGFASMFRNTTGSYNAAIGKLTLYNNTTGNNNTAAGYNALLQNTTGYSNVGIGTSALTLNTTVSNLVAVGDSALFHLSGGLQNTAIGSKALFGNTTGSYNTATGYQALFANTAGQANTANGIASLYSNTTGSYNTANGNVTLYSNTTGSENTANGDEALYANTTGGNNTANGDEALYANTTGADNTANGVIALYSNTTGDDNTANGDETLVANTTGNNNTANGFDVLPSNTTGSDNTAIGAYADVNAINYGNSTQLGYGALGTANNQIRIGDNSITSIGGYANWTNISDGRVKKNIKQNVPGLAFINLLKPITYNLDLDAADKIVQPPVHKDKDGKAVQLSQDEFAARQAKEQVVYTGFIAQDVQTAAQSLNYDFSGVDAAKNSKDLYGLRYSDFVVPLVQAMQELSKQNDSLKKSNTQQNAVNSGLQNQINDLKAEIQQLQSCSPCTQQQTTTAAVAASIQNITLTDEAALEQNVPNPFHGSTMIGYTLPADYSQAQIIIRDNYGKTLKVIPVSGNGKGSLNVDASTIAGGAYNYSLLIDGKLIDTKKMILAK